MENILISIDNFSSYDICFHEVALKYKKQADFLEI